MARSISDLHIKQIEALISPQQLQSEFPVSEEIATTIASGRDQIESILSGKDPRLLVIVGPCSIHDEKAALEYASRLKGLAENLNDQILVVMRVYFE